MTTVELNTTVVGDVTVRDLIETLGNVIDAVELRKLLSTGHGMSQNDREQLARVAIAIKPVWFDIINGKL